MTRVDELEEILAAEGFRSDAHDVGGRGLHEAYCIERVAAAWLVYYRERGKQLEPREFGSEYEACSYFLELIRRDPTTKSRRPS
jgi:hypothetical protein